MDATAAKNGVVPFEDEYEYEYDEIETETFYVDVDMAGAQGLTDSERPIRRKAPKDANAGPGTPGPTTSASAGASRPSQQRKPNSSNVPSEAGDNDHDQAVDDDKALPAIEANGQPTKEEIQILDPGGLNPIVSFAGHYFSCTWSDMIGTNMFFKEPSQGSQSVAPLLRGDGYDLQCVSRIKLIAQKAKVTALPGRRKRPRTLDDDEIVAGELEDEAQMSRGKALGTLRSPNPVINLEIRKQASFLERLMDIKHKKGENDNVRTAFPLSTVSNKSDRLMPADGHTLKTKEDYAKEIESLNRRVVRGDRDALFRLEEIYEQMEDEQQVPKPASAAHDRAESGTPSVLINTPATNSATEIAGD